ncbi:MAG: FKBP-type peptidyl-prolyl cis-trans isomerase [Melioribacteraceae bacterium]|nr:FKBP-type peptidyl-prolyl cis-trans isomerase [Melioribacteraceae bacterium]
MKYFKVFILLILIAGSVSCQQEKKKINQESVDRVIGTKHELTSSIDSISYAIGLELGTNLHRKGADDLVLPILFEAFESAFKDSAFSLTHEEARDHVVNYQIMLQNREVEQIEKQTMANRENADKFFAENRSKEGVIEHENGMQYKVIKEGEGESPGGSDKAYLYYKAKKLNGEVFDESDRSKDPFGYDIDRIIGGWRDALMMMKPGSIYEVYVPDTLGYGKKGAKGIEPGEAIIYELEMISWEPNLPPKPKSDKKAEAKSADKNKK